MANTPNNLNELFGLPLPTTGDGHSSSVVNNYKNLNDSVTAVDGTYDSNANKIWNDATSAELQMKLGDTLGNYAITTDDKGNKFQMVVDAEGNSKLVPYAGKTRRFYEYGTKDPNSNAVKFGLSTGQYSSSDARYSDLLGHPSGELGVDVRRKILDVELPYDKATELEAVLHGNKTAQQARLVQLGDAKKRKLYGSGASEYYSSVEGVLGDVSGVDLSGVSVPKFVNDEDTKRATRPKVSGNVHDIVNLLLPDGTSATSAYKLPEETIDRFGTVAKGDIGNAIVGGLGTVVKEGVLRPLDFIGDVTGTFSLGDVDKRFDKFIGYDTTNTRKVQAKVSGLTDIVLDGNAPTADRLAAGMQATYETVKDPDQLTTSLGTLAAWMLPGTWLKLLGVGEKAVVASKAIDRAMDAGTMTRTAGTVEKMKLLGTESGLKKLGAEQSGMVSAAFGNVNEQYTEFVKNNNGKELVGADKLEWFATRLPVQLVNQNLDALTDISILRSPGLIRSATQAIDDLGNKQFAKLALGVGEVIGSTVFKEMPKEATQEYTQQMMEVFNKKFGSEKFKDLDTFEKFVTDKENLKESVQAALSGAGGAVQFKALDTGFKAPKVVADAVQSGISRVQQAQTQGETEQIPVPSSPTTLSEKYGSPETAKSTVDSTMAEFNKAIEDNKIGTANKLLTKLYEDIKIDTEGHIDREVFTAARDLVVQKNDNIAARIADNNGEIDAETMQLLGSDKDSIGMLFQKTSTPELEHMVSKLPADANKAVVSQLRALVVERKTLDQVSTQISADMRKYWDNVKYGTIDSDREAMLTSMVRLASNEIDKVSKMQADIEEVEARIRSDIEARPSATVGDFKGSKTVQYPAGGSYVINYRNIAEKVLSEGTDNVVRTGVYKTLDRVKDEATAAKRITAMAMKAIDKKKVKDEQPTAEALDTTTTPVDNVAEVSVPEPVVDATPTFTKRTMSWVVSRLSEKPSARNEDMQKEAIDEMLKSPEEGIQELTNAIVELQQLVKEANEDGDKAEARELRNEIKHLEEAIEKIKAVISDINVPNAGVNTVISDVNVDEIQTQSAEDSVVETPVDGSVAVTSATDEGKPSRGKEVLDGAPLFNQNIGGVKVQSNLAAETFQDSGRGIDTSLLSEITAAVFNGKVQSVHREIHKVLQQLVKYDEFSHVKTQSNPFLMFVHKDKNYGQLFVDRKIAEAFTVGLTAYIADKFGTLRNNDNTQIQKLLGTTSFISASVRTKLSKQGRLLDNEADAIGRMIVSAMGVKAKDDVDYDMQERLASSVGTVALMVFQELGMVEIDNSMDANQLSHMRSIAEKLDVDGVPATMSNMPKYDPSKAVSFVKMTLKYSGGGKLAKWLPIATRNKELITTLQNEMEVERFTKEPRLDTEAKSKVFKTRNAETWTNITEEQMATLNKAQNTPFKVNMEAVGDLIDMWGENTGELTVQQIKVAQLFGYDTVEDKHIDRRGGVTAKNNDIVESIQALVDFSKIANGRKVYFDYFFSKNGRFFMDSNTVNPQTDKLHRFLVTVDGGNTTIDDSSRDVYKIAIVQAFDQEKDLSSMDEDGTELRDIGAIDKQRQEDTIAQFDNIVNNVKIQEAVEAIRNSAENRVDKVLAAISNSKHPGHALAALRALVNYNESENFEADITMETDGTTSGFLLGLMTNPVMPFHKLVEWLAKGGVWVGSKTAETYGEWKSIAGNKDGYETSASAVDVAVKRHSITRPGILDFVGGVNRSFMKNPLMIFVYGAGIRRIRREIGQQAADKMIDSLSAGKSFDSMKLIIEDEIGVLRENRTEEGLKKQDILNIDKKIRELVSLRKELDGSVERLASKIREESVDANGMVTKLHKVVSSAAEKTYGAEVGNYLEDTFSELVSMRKAMNDVFDVSYKVFIDEFNRRSKEALTPGKTKLSKKQLEMLLADMVDEGKVPGILTVEATHRDEKAPIMKERKQPGLGDESRVQIGYAKDGKISTRTVHPMIYKMLANSAAGSVINIHYLDGAIIGKIIADGQGFGIHDAFVAHVNDVIGNVKKYNENVWTMTQEYDMLQRTLDELRRVHAANPELVEEHYTITNNGEVIPMFDDKIAELESMVNTINENKRLLSSMRIVSAQMAGPIGSTFDKPGLEDVVAKADNVGNMVAIVGLVRDTEGMSKENSDIVTASIKTDCKVNK